MVVLVVLAAAAVSYRFELGPRWFGFEHPDPATAPALVAPPEGLELPALEVPSSVADPASDSSIAPGQVRRAMARTLADPDLGPDVFAAVTSLAEGAPVFSRGSGVAVPASTMKLLTTTAALSALGPDHTFTTDVVSGGRGRVVLVGGGDPFLASRPASATTYPHRADVVTLARATATALREQGVRRVRVGYDDSLFTGPDVNPRWPDDYVPDGVVSPITALWVDEGRPPGGLGRVTDPSRAAADAFSAALRRAGVEVVGAPTPRRAEPGATGLASVESAPLAGIVEQTLALSDNEAAEVLGHHVGLAATGRGSYADGAQGVVGILRELGVPVAGARVYDGSGLSRDDRLDPRTLVAVLQVAASDEHPELRPVVTGLPVAGFSGSLELRFAEGGRDGLGRVRAKTGTLTGVSALAGIATDRDGNPMVFALLADRVALEDTLAARDALDELAAALAACRCGG
ncbi:MAG TPA: D-alanyl-D-alanine carboxypeptidase/D-alanyl-D-alanine-endopeptidase [Nocardioides sp.]|nr:D-alanyl-D-alanine carboxypeptidase/D-alanyl-D-alanine-endopeptidase [Nocardioides sp.]